MQEEQETQEGQERQEAQEEREAAVPASKRIAALIARILLCMVGAVVGVVFNLNAVMTLVSLFSDGNTVAEGFNFIALVPFCMLVGAIVGPFVALRVMAVWHAGSASKPEGRRGRRMVIGLLLGVPAAFVAIRWAGQKAEEPPSDAAMLRHFEQQARIFETLIGMTNKDKELKRVDGNWTMPDDLQSIGVSSERLAMYRQLLREAGTPRGFERPPDQPEVEFLFWLRGSAVSDDETKGFAYRSSPPPRVLPTLDDIRVESRDYWIAHRHIGGNWYLFYEFVPG